jgi:hypothetical protein
MHAKKLPTTNDENEVLRRMLHTPPMPHKMPAKKAAVKKAAKKTSRP